MGSSGHYLGTGAAPLSRQPPPGQHLTAGDMKTQLPLLCLALLAAAAQAAGPLPQYMVGKYVLETSEGFDNYMWELGVNWFTRKVSALNTAKKLQKLQYINHPLL